MKTFNLTQWIKSIDGKPLTPANDHFDIIAVNECREIMETARDVSDTFKTMTVFTSDNIAKVRRMDIRVV